MKQNYSIGPAGAMGDFIEIIQRHHFTDLVRSLVDTNPGFLRAFAEIAIQEADSDKGRAILARLGPAPQPSEREKVELAYRAMARDFNAGQRHRKRLAKLLIETVSDVLGREGAE